nr:MAG TPA: hypothetical protein [Bacteriophage sp.]
MERADLRAVRWILLFLRGMGRSNGSLQHGSKERIHIKRLYHI